MDISCWSLVADLDGFIFPIAQQEEPRYKHEYGSSEGFSFDSSSEEQNLYDQYSNSAKAMAKWGCFENRNMAHNDPQNTLAWMDNSIYQKSLAQLQHQHGGLTQMQVGPGMASLALYSINLPSTPPTSSNYGQVAPSRSNSATSEPSKNCPNPRKTTWGHSIKRRRRGKAQSKLPPRLLETTSNAFKHRMLRGRTRINMVQQTPSDNPEYDKRKLSLEKNRVAATKCRNNKKKQTEQLQRDSHAKARENLHLRGLVETMEDERNKLIVCLSAHANSADCRRPSQRRGAIHML